MILTMMTSSNENISCVTGPLCGEVTGPREFLTQRPVTRNFDVFFDLRLNKRLSKQPWGCWFETPSWSLWRQCNDDSMNLPVWTLWRPRGFSYKSWTGHLQSHHNLHIVTSKYNNTVHYRDCVYEFDLFICYIDDAIRASWRLKSSATK